MNNNPVGMIGARIPITPMPEVQEVPEVSEVMRALNTLAAAEDVLKFSIVRLEERISPVMRPPTPENVREQIPGSEVTLAAAILAVADRICDHNGRLHNILARIEL